MTRRHISKLMIVLWIVTTVIGCRKKDRDTEHVTFDVKGVVISIDYPKHRITLDHEEIPNYMMAMTMPFKVKDTTLLYGVQVGDSVEGVLAVSRSESWLEILTPVGAGEGSVGSGDAGDRILRRLYKIGDQLPDFSFVNQENKRVRLSDYRGKVTAITFVYTRCPLPDFCIRMSNHFARIQKNLSKDPLVKNKWQLITVSFDPAFDTPPVLKKYSKVYTDDLGTWDFVTDSLKTILDIADGLELVVEDDEGGLLAHNLRTAVLDQNGVLVSVYKGNEWTAEELEATIRSTIKQGS